MWKAIKAFFEPKTETHYMIPKEHIIDILRLYDLLSKASNRGYGHAEARYIMWEAIFNVMPDDLPKGHYQLIVSQAHKPFLIKVGAKQHAKQISTR